MLTFSAGDLEKVETASNPGPSLEILTLWYCTILSCNLTGPFLKGNCCWQKNMLLYCEDPPFKLPCNYIFENSQFVKKLQIFKFVL